MRIDHGRVDHDRTGFVERNRIETAETIAECLPRTARGCSAERRLDAAEFADDQERGVAGINRRILSQISEAPTDAPRRHGMAEH